MFSKTPDDRPSTDKRGPEPSGRAGSGLKSVLASDLRVDGIVATEGTLEVHGRIDGEVAADILLVGDDGVISGKVRASQADLRGRLDGEVVSQRLTLRAAARMEADATCEVLVIEAGAQVQGSFSRPEPPPPPAPPAPPPAAAAPQAAKPAAPAPAAEPPRPAPPEGKPPSA
jgi:cytoskeletal protein CcmA (bactofilin family)